jgi:TIGR03009 family protein
LLVLALVLAGPPSARGQAPGGTKERPPVGAILRNWEERSKGRNTVEARFTRVDRSAVWGNTEYRGRASLQAPELARLELSKVDREKNPPALVPYEDVLCTGKHVLQYKHESRQVFVFPLARDERQRVLDEGPLPFLFHTRADALQQRYGLSLHSETRDAHVIDVRPRTEADREAFSRAVIWLNKGTFLPDKLVLVDPNGQDTKEYTFTLITENQAFPAGTFQGRRLPGWTVVENPAGPPPARAGARPPARERK